MGLVVAAFQAALAIDSTLGLSLKQPTFGMYKPASTLEPSVPVGEIARLGK
jgi:hypothetical protein